MRRPALTPAEIKAITDAHAAGVPIKTITATHNVAPSTIWDHVHAKTNIELTGGRWTINTRTRVLEYILDCDQAAS